MKVTQKFINRYQKKVDEQADLARSYVSRSIKTYLANNPGASTADVRQFTIDLLEAALPNFTDTAGALALEFFDEITASQDIQTVSTLYDTIDYKTVEEKVRYFAGKLNDGDEEAFRKQVIDATHYFVKRSAYDNLVKNCEDNAVRYARVPSGFETCAFCFMLASRGFVYHSELTAKGLHGYHNHCSCAIVPGTKGRVKIDGYDPQGMADRLEMCAQTIGSHKRKELMREVRTRDWHWLYTGKGPAYKAEEGANPDEWEKEVGRILRERNGLSVVFRRRSLLERDRRADTQIGGASYEIKNPTGTNPLCIHNQVKKNLYGSGRKKVLNPQSDRLIISNVRSDLSFEELVLQSESVLSGRTELALEELNCIKEIIIVDKNGIIKRLKR